jgi:tetratricopeptide (TPR) repeat protein
MSYLDLADRHFRARRYDEAIANYKLAIEASDRPYQTTYLNLGSAQYEKGDYEAAAESFRRAIQLKPNDYRGHYNLAETLYALARTRMPKPNIAR